jgi:uncharacterized protein (TIGR03067 family)
MNSKDIALLFVILTLPAIHLQSAGGQASDKNSAAVKVDLELLQGSWSHAAREEKGKQIIGEAKEVLIVFRGNLVVFKKGTEVSQVCLLKKIDATASPKKFDLVITDGPNEGLTIFAIYEVNDGVFRYCGGIDGRPTSFKTSEEDKGYVYCSSYKRARR